MSEILKNPKARRDFHILDSLEAGIVLKGTEVKSLRAGKGQISDAFVRVEDGVPLLYNAHIDEYNFGNRQNHAPKAPRRLLLHKSEIRKLHEAGAIKATPSSRSRSTGKTAESKSRSHSEKVSKTWIAARISRNASQTVR